MVSSQKNPNSRQEDNFYSNYSLLVPYIAPYLAYVAIASLFSGLSPVLNYSIRIIVVSLLLWWFRRWYIPITGSKSKIISIIVGIIFGIIGAILWILMLKPFVNNGAEPWDDLEILTRLIASSLLVPIFEELLMRGYIFRLTFQWSKERKNNKNALENALHEKSINDFEPGAWSVSAILVSTVAFTIGHQIIEFPAAIIYGILMAFLWIYRKDMISCIVAHGTTNFTLGIYVCLTQQWELW
jgi:membrane protease YdiL (CAAX protease family)